LCEHTMNLIGGLNLIAGTALILAGSLQAQQNDKRDPECGERNGFFPDGEMCDKYFECRDGVAEEKYCSDGLLFNAKDPNKELCDYPFNVDCEDRLYVQEPEPDLPAQCQRANGYFNHEDVNNCKNYYVCVHGKPIKYTCAGDLVFDEGRGTCVGREDVSPIGRKCVGEPKVQQIDGVTCKPALAPNGQPYAHPSFASYDSCQDYVVCYFGTTPTKLGCAEGQVFDEEKRKCVTPEEGPLSCRCWYSCPSDSNCPNDCNTDCTCPT